MTFCEEELTDDSGMPRDMRGNSREVGEPGETLSPVDALVRMLQALPIPAQVYAWDGALELQNSSFDLDLNGEDAESTHGFEGVLQRARSGEIVRTQPTLSRRGLIQSSTFFRVAENREGRSIVVRIVQVVPRGPLEGELLGGGQSAGAAATTFARIGSWEQLIGTPEDPEDNPLTWSDEVYRIFGYEPGEIAAHSETFYGIVHPEDRALVREAVRRALEEGEDYSVEHRIVLPTGEVRWVREQSHVERGPDGAAQKMIGTILDITEGRRIEEVLRETEQNLRKIIDLIPQSIYCKDSNGRLLFANRGFYSLTGLSPTAHAEYFQKDWCETEEQADQYLQEDQEVIRTGAPRFLPDEVFRDPSGQTHILQTVKVPFAIAGTQNPAVLGISLEITELKKVQDQLESQYALLSGMMESTDEPIFALDRFGDCTHFNSAFSTLVERVSGGSPDRIDPLQLAPTPDERSRMRQWFQRALEGERFVEEFHFQAVDSWYEVSLNPLRGSTSEVTGVAVFMKNVTAKRAALQAIRELNSDLEQRVQTRTAQLAHANKELESFVYSISHDLRSPLRAIDGFSDILKSEHAHELTDEAREHLDRVRRASQRMGELIDGLLSFSRLGRQALVCRRFSTAQVVGEALDELTPLAKGRDIQFKVGHLPPCSADRILVRTVFSNLIENAIKFTGTRKTAVIEIGAFDRNGQTVWFVRDNGVGFDMKYAEQMFGVFNRLHRPDEFEGTGVGLALVNRIVSRHGGEIWAESAPDQGARFCFTLGHTEEVGIGEGSSRDLTG